LVLVEHHDDFHVVLHVQMHHLDLGLVLVLY
jgi:hypothetical protein